MVYTFHSSQSKRTTSKDLHPQAAWLRFQPWVALVDARVHLKALTPNAAPRNGARPLGDIADRRRRVNVCRAPDGTGKWSFPADGYALRYPSGWDVDLPAVW